MLDSNSAHAYHSTMKLNDSSNAMDLAMTALAHPTRRAILERVMRRETRVTELAEPFAVSLNAVSKHIRILERARLVRRRRAWREHLVSFNPEPLNEVSAWIEKARAYWSARLDTLEELLKAEDAAAQQPAEKGKPK
jgi:DNA-binding transcriptional ArsR family regulator